VLGRDFFTSFCSWVSFLFTFLNWLMACVGTHLFAFLGSIVWAQLFLQKLMQGSVTTKFNINETYKHQLIAFWTLSKTTKPHHSVMTHFSTTKIRVPKDVVMRGSVAISKHALAFGNSDNTSERVQKKNNQTTAQVLTPLSALSLAHAFLIKFFSPFQSLNHCFQFLSVLPRDPNSTSSCPILEAPLLAHTWKSQGTRWDILVDTAFSPKWRLLSKHKMAAKCWRGFLPTKIDHAFSRPHVPQNSFTTKVHLGFNMFQKVSATWPYKSQLMLSSSL